MNNQYELSAREKFNSIINNKFEELNTISRQRIVDYLGIKIGTCKNIMDDDYYEISKIIQKQISLKLNFNSNLWEKEYYDKDEFLYDVFENENTRYNYDSKDNNTLRKMPFGIVELNDNNNLISQYSEKLSDKILPYFKRSEFKSENNISNNFETELDLYNKLFVEDNNILGLLISGIGGIGKTRLMYELARKSQKDNWICYQIFEEFEGWESLSLEDNKNYCFIFDYIEINKHFTNETINILNRQYNNCNIRVIANYRNSYSIDNEFDNSCLYKMKLNIENKHEKKYIEYVNLNIFKTLTKNSNKLEENNFLNLINIPSFVIFFIDGLNKYDIDYNKIQDFNCYVKKRLRLTFAKNDITEISNNVFKILFLLPCNFNDKTLNNYLNRLEFDGYIKFDEINNSYVANYNDTIIDEILYIYLSLDKFEYGNSFNIIVNSIIKFSIRNKKFENVFNAFNKIFNKFNNRKKYIIKDIFNNNYLNNLSYIIDIFNKSDIFNGAEKFEILDELYLIEIERLIDDDYDYDYLTKRIKNFLKINNNDRTYLLKEESKDIPNTDNILELFSKL